MKKVLLLTLLVLALTAAYAQKAQITVDSDEQLNTDFSKYKTFYWASQVDNELDEGGIFFLNDLVLKAQIRDAVRSELMGLGYRESNENPDLVVNFRVFDKPARLKGTEGYGTDYWGSQQYRSISDTTTYDVDAGTLLIDLVDRQQGTIVWQGFASGLINENQFIKDETTIHEAVNLIFDQYGQRAKEYSMKK
jgi:hypothetical protein